MGHSNVPSPERKSVRFARTLPALTCGAIDWHRCTICGKDCGVRDTRGLQSDDLVVVAVGVKASVELAQQVGSVASEVGDGGDFAFLKSFVWI